MKNATKTTSLFIAGLCFTACVAETDLTQAQVRAQPHPINTSAKDYTQAPVQTLFATLNHPVNDLAVDSTGNVFTTGLGSTGVIFDGAGQVIHDLGTYPHEWDPSWVRLLPSGDFLVFNPSDSSNLAIYDAAGVEKAVLARGEHLYSDDVTVSASGSVVIWNPGEHTHTPTRLFDAAGHALGEGPPLFRPTRFDSGSFLAGANCDGFCFATFDPSGVELWRQDATAAANRTYLSAVVLAGDRFALPGATATELRSTDGTLLAEWPAPAELQTSIEVLVNATPDGGFYAAWLYWVPEKETQAYYLVIGPDGAKRAEFRASYGNLLPLEGNLFLVQGGGALSVYDELGQQQSTFQPAPQIHGAAALTPSGDVIAVTDCLSDSVCHLYLYTYPMAQ